MEEKNRVRTRSLTPPFEFMAGLRALPDLGLLPRYDLTTIIDASFHISGYKETRL